MKLIAFILLIIALAIPASASSVVSWTQKDITDNLTLNYTSEFNVAKDDILNIYIKNIGNVENDTITVYKIRVNHPSEADGLWTGSVEIKPNTNRTIDFSLNVNTDDEETVNINLYYTVNHEDKTLSIKANYNGKPESSEIKPWNNITNSRSRTLSVNIDHAVRFNATSDQIIGTWVWRKDNVVQNNDLDYFTASWGTSGDKTVKVNATNYNGTSSTITWDVTVNAPDGNAPYITSWGNSNTNNGSLDLTINQSETVRFNFTANQTLTSWHWTLNGETISNPSDDLIRKFNSDGNYRVRASGSNDNGSTQTILWKITVEGTDERNEDDHAKINDDIISWHPQVVDYIYVNDSISETIDYSITTAEPLINVKWTEDGTVVDGDTSDNIYNYYRTWDDGDLGFHTIAFKGTDDADNEVEFRWYVNVYEINGLRGGNWFDVIDYSNVKIKMFKVKTAKYGSNSENTINFVNRLHDSIATRQMTREALRDAFKSGDLSVSEYVAALKQIQSDIKDDLKITKRMNDIEKGIEKDDEEEDQEDNYLSERVKQNRVNKPDSKDDKKKDSSVARNSNGNGNNNNGNNGKNRKDDKEDD